MSISDKLRSAAGKAGGAACLKSARTYFRWALFCGLFAAIYENFGHGVYSLSMILMFLYPLAGAAVFALIAVVPALEYPLPWPERLLGAGVAALTVGSCFRGIVEIYGTTSAFIAVYYVVGAALAAAGAVVYIADSVRLAKARRAK